MDEHRVHGVALVLTDAQVQEFQALPLKVLRGACRLARDGPSSDSSVLPVRLAADEEHYARHR